MNKGLTYDELKDFGEYLKKANLIQLRYMHREVVQEETMRDRQKWN